MCLTESAVAAIRADGSVVVAGDSFGGGDVDCMSMTDFVPELIVEKLEALHDIAAWHPLGWRMARKGGSRGLHCPWGSKGGPGKGV